MMGARKSETEPKLQALARRLTEAAVEVTGDDPLRGTSILAVAAHLGIDDWDEIDSGIAEAARLGWLRTSGGKKPHSVSVTATWRRDRAPRGRRVLTAPAAPRTGKRRGL